MLLYIVFSVKLRAVSKQHRIAIGFRGPLVSGFMKTQLKKLTLDRGYTFDEQVPELPNLLIIA